MKPHVPGNIAALQTSDIPMVLDRMRSAADQRYGFIYGAGSRNILYRLDFQSSFCGVNQSATAVMILST